MKSPYFPSVLLVASYVFARPGLLGEQLAPVGVVLALAALCVALFQDRSAAATHDFNHWTKVAVTASALIAAAYSLRAAATESYSDSFSGLISLLAGVVATTTVLRERSRAKATTRLFVGTCLAVAASWVVTAGIWALTSADTGIVATIHIGTFTTPQPFFLPATVTAGRYEAFGVNIHRLTGLTREPGWMAMYLTVAFLLYPHCNWRRGWPRLLLPLALLGTVSTAGFGIFTIVLAARRFFSPNNDARPELAIAKHLLGIFVISAATWIAFFAPVVGLSSKRSVNELSLTERQVATEAGLRALYDIDLLGGGGTAINLIASSAAYGVAYALLILAGLMALNSKPSAAPAYRAWPAGTVAIILTLLFSQPPHDATVAYCLVLLCAANRQQASSNSHDDARHAPTVRERQQRSAP